MQAVPRHDWIEFLDALEIEGEVTLASFLFARPDDVPRRVGNQWTVRLADFDPFDHVIEVILDNHEVSVRLLIDDPKTVTYEGETHSPTRLLIGSNEGVVEVSAG
jgi:hypothetical protein